MHDQITKIVTDTLRKKKGQSLGLMLVILAALITALIPPILLGRMVDQLSEGHGISFVSAACYLLIFAVAGILESFQNGMITMAGQSITHGIRRAMSQKLKSLPASYYTNNEAGNITSRFVNDVDTVDSLFTNGLISMLVDCAKVISIMAVIFVKSLGLGLLLCLITPFLCWMTFVFQKRMKQAQYHNREAVAKVSQHVPETIRNIRMIHTFSCENYMKKKYRTYIEAGYHAMDQSNFYDAIYSPIVLNVSAVVVAVMMICAGKGAEFQKFFGISVGSAVAVIAYVGKVFDPLESLGMEIQNIQSALAGAARIEEFLAEEELAKVNENAKTGSIDGRTDQEICFEHVSFSYEPGKEILHDQSFSIESGEHVIFTGRTGAGKSTVFKLLSGLYLPDAGRITIYGKEAGSIPEHERRHLIGCVEQQFHEVEGTILDQITLFDPEITREEVWKVLVKCGLEKKIRDMPQEIDTPMKSADLSQGERQLLSIARALVAEPKILLLDEMTAGLDSTTEKKILAAIRQASRGRTVLSISHRLAEQSENTRILHLMSEETV